MAGDAIVCDMNVKTIKAARPAKSARGLAQSKTLRVDGNNGILQMHWVASPLTLTLSPAGARESGCLKFASRSAIGCFRYPPAGEACHFTFQPFNDLTRPPFMVKSSRT
jgi:hypothetical protein